MKPLMPRMFLILEGIDGSGKSTFADLFRSAIRQSFAWREDRPLAMVGQPSFCYDSSGAVRRFVEDGMADLEFESIVDLLTKNRHRHEGEISAYGGVTLCVRGVLTELATLERLYGQTPAGFLGQERVADHLIVLDIDPALAHVRIKRRGAPLQWRESPSNLEFFRSYYLRATPSPVIRNVRVIRNDGDSADLQRAVLSLVSELQSLANESALPDGGGALTNAPA